MRGHREWANFFSRAFVTRSRGTHYLEERNWNIEDEF